LKIYLFILFKLQFMIQLSQELSGNFVNLVRPQEPIFEDMKNYPSVCTSCETENQTHILGKSTQK